MVSRVYAQHIIYKVSTYSDVCVRFTDLTVGTVVRPADGYNLGHTSRSWTAYTNDDVWRDLTEEECRNIKDYRQPLKLEVHIDGK